MTRYIQAGIILGTLLLTAAPSWAYTRTLTCTESGQYACEAGEEAKELFWDATSVRYHLNERGSTEFASQAPVFEEIRRSFDAWTEPDCSFLELIDGGFTDEERVGYELKAGQSGNVNVVMFRDNGWNHAGGVLALTSVTFVPKTGEILDADLEVNTEQNAFTLEGSSGTFDLRNTLTHEVGHFIGLDHSTVRDATMFATAVKEETLKRDLHQDDIDGICAIYPAESRPSVDSVAGAPDGFFDAPDYSNLEEDDGSTCSAVAPHRSGSPWALSLLLVGAAGAFLVRRMR